MAIHRDVLREIKSITGFLVERGLADDQNFAFQVQRGESINIQYSNTAGFSSILRDRPYAETYLEQRDDRLFNLKLLDGALIQMMYEFNKKRLSRYRLAFLPSPDLLEFQNYPELYMEESYYADVIERRVVTVPLRFDYDGRPGVSKPLEHPESHLTLGQYSRCRIPTTAPLTPYLFIEFILRSFYNTALETITDDLPRQVTRFAECIDHLERSVLHIGVPALA